MAGIGDVQGRSVSGLQRQDLASSPLGAVGNLRFKPEVGGTKGSSPGWLTRAGRSVGRLVSSFRSEATKARSVHLHKVRENSRKIGNLLGSLTASRDDEEATGRIAKAIGQLDEDAQGDLDNMDGGQDALSTYLDELSLKDLYALRDGALGSATARKAIMNSFRSQQSLENAKSVLDQIADRLELRLAKETVGPALQQLCAALATPPAPGGARQFVREVTDALNTLHTNLSMSGSSATRWSPLADGDDGVGKTMPLLNRYLQSLPVGEREQILAVLRSDTVQAVHDVLLVKEPALNKMLDLSDSTQRVSDQKTSQGQNIQDKPTPIARRQGVMDYSPLVMLERLRATVASSEDGALRILPELRQLRHEYEQGKKGTPLEQSRWAAKTLHALGTLMGKTACLTENLLPSTRADVSRLVRECASTLAGADHEPGQSLPMEKLQKMDGPSLAYLQKTAHLDDFFKVPEQDVLEGMFKERKIEIIQKRAGLDNLIMRRNVESVVGGVLSGNIDLNEFMTRVKDFSEFEFKRDQESLSVGLERGVGYGVFVKEELVEKDGKEIALSKEDKALMLSMVSIMEEEERFLIDGEGSDDDRVKNIIGELRIGINLINGIVENSVLLDEVDSKEGEGRKGDVKVGRGDDEKLSLDDEKLDIQEGECVDGKNIDEKNIIQVLGKAKEIAGSENIAISKVEGVDDGKKGVPAKLKKETYSDAVIRQAIGKQYGLNADGERGLAISNEKALGLVKGIEKVSEATKASRKIELYDREKNEYKNVEVSKQFEFDAISRSMVWMSVNGFSDGKEWVENDWDYKEKIDFLDNGGNENRVRSRQLNDAMVKAEKIMGKDVFEKMTRCINQQIYAAFEGNYNFFRRDFSGSNGVDAGSGKNMEFPFFILRKYFDRCPEGEENKKILIGLGGGGDVICNMDRDEKGDYQIEYIAIMGNKEVQHRNYTNGSAWLPNNREGYMGNPVEMEMGSWTQIRCNLKMSWDFEHITLLGPPQFRHNLSPKPFTSLEAEPDGFGMMQ